MDGKSMHFDPLEIHSRAVRGATPHVCEAVLRYAIVMHARYCIRS
jgi:hypothetical protein